MNENFGELSRVGLIWLGAHRAQWAPDALLVIMVVAVALNAYAFIRQQRTLVELLRLLLIVRQGAIVRRLDVSSPTRPLVLSNGVVAPCLQERHRYHMMPRIIGGEGDEH